MFSILFSGQCAIAQDLEEHWWQPNGTVHAVVKDGNTVYLGGDFTSVGPSEAYGSAIGAIDGIPNFNYLNPDGAVKTVISDGAGGWYIGGGFTQVGGQTRNRIAQLDSNGGLTTFGVNQGFNDSVNVLVLNDGILYAGGGFTSHGSVANGHGIALGNTDGTPDFNYLLPNEAVSVVIPDGYGGWYIGGYFTQVGGVDRSRLARINADGTLHPWNPSSDNAVLALAINGNTVYAGGTFTSIGGQPRNRIAALDATTGNVTEWNPNANEKVYALAVSGNTVYAGGQFSSIGGQFRNKIAALDATNGSATGWNPNAGNIVRAISISGNTIYVGGNFTSIGGQTRNRIAALDAATGNATAWNPNAGNTVLAIAISGSTVYVGGDFTSIGGQTRNRIASLNANTGSATNWNPSANSSVHALSISGNIVYAGGYFVTIGGQSRKYIAALDATTSNATSWTPNVNGTVHALSVSGSTVYAGGLFTSIGGQPRNRIAALDAITGAVTAWNPNANGTVYALSVSGSTVYAGGNFGSIGGQTRNNIAALNNTTGAATAWNPNLLGTSGIYTAVHALAVSGGTVYVGGSFSSIGGQSRVHIAALDAATGNTTPWYPSTNGVVNSLIVSGSVVYAGGEFTTIYGLPRNRLAALDATTGIPTSWNPDSNNAIRTLIVSGGTIYAGGQFTSIGGQTRNRLAAIDVLTGVATEWNPCANNAVFSLAVSGSVVFAGGQFTSTGGQTRNRIAALDATTGAATEWNPNSSDVVRTLSVKNGTVYVGGDFTDIGGQTRNRIAAIDAFTGTATAWNPNANGTVYAVSVSGSTVYAGGNFGSIGGQPRNYIAALNAANGDATFWNPNGNNAIRSITVKDSTVLVGGTFTNIGGQNRMGIAALDTTTGIATAWNPNAVNPGVFSIAVNGSKVYVGGAFSFVGGQPRKQIAALDAATGIVTAWNPNASAYGYVHDIEANGSVVYACGQFTSIGGQSRNNIAALNDGTGLATTWNPNANGSVNTLAVSGSTVYVGGAFTSIGGQPRSYFAVFSSPSISTGTLSNIPLCSGSDISVPFTISVSGSNDNVFTAQLSDIAGSFNNPITIGSFTSITSGTITATIPSDTPTGTGYRIRVVSSSPAIIGTDNGVDLTITAPPMWYLDTDNDGYYVSTQSSCTSPGLGWTSTLPANGANDCNDNNAALNTITTETCNNLDDDCDGAVDNGLNFVNYYNDTDGDGYGAGTATNACSQPANTVTNNTDCNDNNAALNSITTETCNGFDDDCNGTVDNGLTFVNYYNDTDGDGYGAGTATNACQSPGASYVTNNTDCNDNNAALNSITTETCNNFDDDCDGTVDNGLTFVNYYNDQDSDGYGAGAASNLCSSPGAGYVTNNTDCNDNNAALNSIIAEVCNNFDDDCDGIVDNGLTFVDYYNDQDGDGYGAGIASNACSQPASTVTNNTDCNDSNAAIQPTATEICGNNIDEDCTGSDLICPNNGTFTTTNVLSIGNYGSGSQTTLSVNFAQGADNVESPGTGIDRWFQFTAQANAIRVELSGNTALEDDNDIALYDYSTIAGQPLIPLSIENEVIPGNLGISSDGGNEILYFDQLAVGSTYWICIRNLNNVYGTSALKLSYLRGSSMDIGAYTNYTNTYSSTCQNFKCKFKPGASYYTFNLWNGNIAQGTANWIYSTSPTTSTTATTVLQLGKLVGANINNAPIQHTVKVDAHYALKDAYGNTEQVLGYGVTPGVFTMNTEADLNLRTTDRCPTYKSASSGSLATNRSVCGTTRYIWQLTMSSPMIGLPQNVYGPIGGTRILQTAAILGISNGQQYDVAISSLHFDQQSQSNYGTIQCMKTIGFAGMPIANDDASEITTTNMRAVLYPNPNVGQGFTLNVEGMDGDVVLNVTDATGKLVKTMRYVAEGGFTAQVEFAQALASGLYQVEIMNGTTRHTMRMAVNR